jgi:hypothetical protein
MHHKKSFIQYILKPFFLHWFKNEWLLNKAVNYLCEKESQNIILPLNEYIEDLKLNSTL